MFECPIEKSKQTGGEDVLNKYTVDILFTNVQNAHSSEEGECLETARRSLAAIDILCTAKSLAGFDPGIVTG